LLIRVHNRTRASVLAERAGVADTAPLRNRGLLKHERLDEGEGLWIVPTQSIHMFFMKFAIDAVFLDSSMRVVKIAADLKPWQLASCGKARHTLEIPAGSAAARGIEVGHELKVV
jgi:hypothetical protein